MKLLKKMKWNLNSERIIAVILLIPSIFTSILFVIIQFTLIYKFYADHDNDSRILFTTDINGNVVRSLFDEWLEYNSHYIFNSEITNAGILFCGMAIAGAYLLKKKCL
jgi:hypothetical protein